MLWGRPPPELGGVVTARLRKWRRWDYARGLPGNINLLTRSKSRPLPAIKRAQARRGRSGGL